VTNTSNNGFNGMLKVTVYDLMEDLRFTGMVRIPLINTSGTGTPIVNTPNLFVPGSQSLFNSGSEYLARFDYLKRRIDYTMLYYRRTDVGQTVLPDFNLLVPAKAFTNLYQVGAKYPFNKIKSLRLNAGIREDRIVTKAIVEAPETVKAP